VKTNDSDEFDEKYTTRIEQIPHDVTLHSKLICKNVEMIIIIIIIIIISVNVTIVYHLLRCKWRWPTNPAVYCQLPTTAKPKRLRLIYIC